MRVYATENTDVNVCFVASKSFVSYEPRQARVEQGISVHASRVNSLERLKENKRLIVVDDVVNHSLFPLADILRGVDVDLEVDRPAEEPSTTMHVGTPSKDKQESK